MTARKRSIAFVSVGGVGDGVGGRGIPALVDCLVELSETFEITFYSIVPADAAHAPQEIRLRVLPFRTPFLKLDLLMLGSMVFWGFLTRRHVLIHAISAFPTGWLGVKLAGFLRIPCVVTLHAQEVANLPEVDFGDLRNRRKTKITDWVCRNAAALTLLTRFQAQGLTKLPAPPRRAEIIPLGAKLPRFPFSIRELHSPFLFLNVAYPHPVKGFSILLETFKTISTVLDARLTIVGPGFDTDRIESEILALSLTDTVELAGAVAQSSMHRYFDNAHVLLVTSWYESQGVVINEAMASGVVVCATRVGLAADLGDEYCVIADVGDARDLADKTIELLRDERRYDELRRKARDWSAAHDSKWTAKNFARIYERLLAH